jgi:hypothetical protein
MPNHIMLADADCWLMTTSMQYAGVWRLQRQEWHFSKARSAHAHVMGNMLWLQQLQPAWKAGAALAWHMFNPGLCWSSFAACESRQSMMQS